MNVKSIDKQKSNISEKMKRYSSFFSPSMYWKVNLLQLFLVVLHILIIHEDALSARYKSGKNWQTYKLDDITVHFPEGYQNIAGYVASRTRAHIDSITSWYYRDPGYLHVILNPDVDKNYALASILPMRIQLPVHPVLTKGIRPQKGLYLDRVLAHELTHIAQFRTSTGLFKWLKPVFGEVLAPAAVQPDWAGEGLAIYTESAEGGGRLNSSYYRMLWTTQLLAGKPWSLGQAAHPGIISPHLSRSYITGAMMAEHLASEFGTGKLAEWMYSQGAWPLLPDIAFRRSFRGRSVSESYLRLKTHGLWAFKMEAQARTREGYAVGTPLTKKNRTSWRSPLWRFNNEIVASEESYDSPWKLSLIRKPGVDAFSARDSKTYENIIPVKGTSLSHDHHKLTLFGEGIITSEIRQTGWALEEQTSILVYSDCFGDVKPVGDPPLRGWSPSWSPENGLLAYITPDKKGRLALKTIPLNSQAEPTGKPVTIIKTILGTIADPTWSKNGRLLAFVADTGSGEKIYLWESRTGLLFELTVNGADCTWDPTFSPDGSLWVSADPGGVFDLYQIDIVADSAWQRTRVLSGAIEPSVSPNGKSVVYSHYTHEGFVPALLDSSNWLNEPVKTRIKKVDPSDLICKPGTKTQDLDTRNYNPWKYIFPRFWIPFAGGVNEAAVGAATFGTDPLQLVEIRAKYLNGLETNRPDLEFSLTYRALPLDATVFLSAYPDDLLKVVPEYDYTGAIEGVTGVRRNPLRWEGGIIFSQDIYRNKGPWSIRHTPSFGWINRDRFRQTQLNRGLLVRHYNGLRFEYDYRQAIMANRDPVPRRYFGFNIALENDVIGYSNLDGSLLQGNIRYHLPVIHDGFVLGFKSALQVQDGYLDYSRSLLRPNGYLMDNDLPADLRLGKIASGGASLYFPLLYPDRGILLGAVFLERIYGSVFFEGATGWGENRSLGNWLEKDACGSAGFELGTGWNLFYNMTLKLSAGTAWRSYHEDFSFYFRLGLPLIPGIYDSFLHTGFNRYR